MTAHETYIKRCLQIGGNSIGTSRPNPMVGAVIVHKNRIIGEGFTSFYGGPHAEVNAVNSVADKSLLKESTMYVTLEPCSHFGKTPPCSDMIIRNGIPKVVIGCIDDNPKVAGNGVKKLRASGCEVIVGVLEKECKAHLKRFFTFHNKKRPYVILKWAQTKQGFIAPKTKDKQQPVWITNTYSRQLVHKWRAEEQAILVGTNTVLEDNPNLTVRDWAGNNPIRIVLDKDLKLYISSAVFNGNSKTVILSSKNDNGRTVETIDWIQKDTIAQQICNRLYKLNINSVIIEGGAQTLQTFIDENLWDEARVFEGSITFKDGLKTPNFEGKLIKEEQILDDTLSYYVQN